MGKAFFKPYIGKNYEKGILGKRILVIGASFYCNKTDCPFFNDCTSLEKKDSSKYNEKCWCTERKDIKLENEPSSSISEWSRTYRNFENLFKGILPDGESAYDYYAFTNFVQYFLPAKNGLLYLRFEIGHTRYGCSYAAYLPPFLSSLPFFIGYCPKIF